MSGPDEDTVNARGSMIDYFKTRFGAQQGLPPRRPGTETLNPSHLLNFSFASGSKPQSVAAFESRVGSFLQDAGFEVSQARPGSAPRTDIRSFLQLMSAFSESEAMQIKNLLPARRSAPVRAEAVRLAESLAFGVSSVRWGDYHLTVRAGIILELCPDLSQLDPAARGSGHNRSQWLLDLVCCSLMDQTLHTASSKPWVHNSLAMAAILARRAPPLALLVADGREFLPVVEASPGVGVRPWLAGTSPAAAGHTLLDVLCSEHMMGNPIMGRPRSSPLHEIALAFDALLPSKSLSPERASASANFFLKHCVLTGYPYSGMPDGKLDEPLSQAFSALAHASFTGGFDLHLDPHGPVFKSICKFCPKTLAALEHAEMSHTEPPKTQSKRAPRV